MSNVLSNPSLHSAVRRPARPLPVGIGLVIGAGASLALWAGILWAGVALLT